MEIEDLIDWAHKQRFDKLVTGIRTKSNYGDIAVLEVVIAQGKEFAFQRYGIIEKVTKAYCVAVVMEGSEKGNAKIIPATYRSGVFNANLARFEVATSVRVDPRIIEAAQPTNPFNQEFVPLIEQEGENFVGYFSKNCYRPSKG